jgi:K(+)-stimulated pyrophosphate-energized sodium pump
MNGWANIGAGGGIALRAGDADQDYDFDQLDLVMVQIGGKYLTAADGSTIKNPTHSAAVVGDTVGDPFKDTAGPSLHVLIKLLSTITLVMAPLFL